MYGLIVDAPCKARFGSRGAYIRILHVIAILIHKYE